MLVTSSESHLAFVRAPMVIASRFVMARLHILNTGQLYEISHKQFPLLIVIGA